MKWIALSAIASFGMFAAGCTSGALFIANSASLTGRYGLPPR